VSEIVRSIIVFVLTMGMIVGGFKLFKSQHSKVVLDPSDYSMNADVLAPGKYSIDLKVSSISDLKAGDTVAYYLPGRPSEYRFGHIAALEGERIEVSPAAVKVGGKTTSYKVEKAEWTFPEMVVPRGCVFIIADKSTAWANDPPEVGDSMKIGPVPFYAIAGKVLN
jgi:hypothetical protein